MKRTIAVAVLVVTVAVSAGMLIADTDKKSADATEILRLHKNILRAHMEGDLESWMAQAAEDYVVVSRGMVSFPTKEERAARLGPYLESTTFTEYGDVIEPVVKVSDDGTLGWLIAQVKISGTRTMTGGEKAPVDSEWGWIELYEKRDGRWLCVGNVSNMKPRE